MNDGLLLATNGEIGFQLSRNEHGALLLSARGLITINSVIHPVIYSVTNPRYRKAFVQVFTCASED